MVLPLWGADPVSLKYFELGAAQGFSGEAVNCILQDKRGLLWFGAVGGLASYDGHSFTSWLPGEEGAALPSSIITALLEDDRGAIWVGSDGGGLSRIDPTSNRVVNYGRDDGFSGEAAPIKVLALCQDGKGRMIAGSGDGLLYRWESAQRSFAPLPRAGTGREAIRCLLVDFQGRIWAGTDGGGLLLYNEDGLPLAEYRHDPEEAESLGSDRVLSLFEDSLGSLWLGLGDGGVDFVVGKRFRHSRPPRGWAGLGAAAALVEDTEGRIWAGFAGGGIGSVDPASLEMNPPTKTDVGRGHGISALFRDRSGMIWAGLSGGGVRAYNLRTAPFFENVMAPGGGMLRKVVAMAEDAGGKVLVSTEEAGLLSYDPSGKATTPYSPTLGPGFGRVLTMLQGKDGTLWLGSERSGLLARGPNGSLVAYRADAGKPLGQGSDSITALFEDGDGSLWVGTKGDGLFRLDPLAGRLVRDGAYSKGRGFRPGLSVTCITRDSRGDLWVGFADGGLAYLDKDSGHFLSFGDGKGGFPDSCVTSILEDSGGGLWVGSGGSGFFSVDRTGGRALRPEGEEGLVGSMVYDMLEDPAGILWIASSTGLTAFDRQRGDFYLFGAEDGLTTGRLGRGSALLARDGMLWVGGVEGVVRLDPLRVPRYAPAPEVVITGIEVLGGGKPLSRSADGMELVLDHDNGGLSFRIAIGDYSAPSRNRYAMKLEGRQASWLSLGYSNSGYLAPLPPGHYMLRAKGSNGNGIWNDYGASLSIVVLPPFWATWPFRLLVVAVLAAAAATGIAARLGALRRRNSLLVKFARHIEDAREEERKLAARDVHDEIGQHLTVLNFHAYWLISHPASDEDERSSRLKEMQGVIRDAMAAVKVVATRLRPAVLDALDFASTLRWYVRSFERLSGMVVEIKEDWQGAAINQELTTALFRILQEMLGNVLRHSAAHKVKIRLACEGGEVVLEVRDDGVGIDPASALKADSFGIIGMRERCAAFGGSFGIEGLPGEGTRVVARLRNPSAEKKGRLTC